MAGGQASLHALLQNPDQLALVESGLAMLETSLDSLADLCRPLLPVLPHLSWLPGIEGDVAKAPDLLHLAQQTTEASQALISGLAPLAEPLNEQDTGQNEATLDRFDRIQPLLENAASLLAILPSLLGAEWCSPWGGTAGVPRAGLCQQGSGSGHLSPSYRHRIQHPMLACVHEPRCGDSYADLMGRQNRVA